MISFMIGHGGQTPSHTLKNFTTFTTSSTPAEAPRRRSRGFPHRENFTTPAEKFRVW
jgi:hypothetical protein